MPERNFDLEMVGWVTSRPRPEFGWNGMRRSAPGIPISNGLLSRSREAASTRYGLAGSRRQPAGKETLERGLIARNLPVFSPLPPILTLVPSSPTFVLI